jgi:hypothetical protein
MYSKLMPEDKNAPDYDQHGLVLDHKKVIAPSKEAAEEIKKAQSEQVREAEDRYDSSKYGTVIKPKLNSPIPSRKADTPAPVKVSYRPVSLQVPLVLGIAILNLFGGLASIHDGLSLISKHKSLGQAALYISASQILLAVYLIFSSNDFWTKLALKILALFYTILFVLDLLFVGFLVADFHLVILILIYYAIFKVTFDS